jgi:hypothetical protein
VLQASPFRHHDAIDPACMADWFVSRFDELAAGGDGSPLLVPFTATFAPGAVRADRVLSEYARFYDRLCDELVNNRDRPSKRPLLPFSVAWRDDPRTRPGKYYRRPKLFSDHPESAPHVHGLMLIHPTLGERFESISGDLEQAWRSISYRPAPPFADALYRYERPAGQPIYVNRTLRFDLELGYRMTRGLYEGAASARAEASAEMARWLSYCSKMTLRWDAGEEDAYIVLPATAAARSRSLSGRALMNPAR